jgi:hypothetical protein
MIVSLSGSGAIKGVLVDWFWSIFTVFVGKILEAIRVVFLGRREYT